MSNNTDIENFKYLKISAKKKRLLQYACLAFFAFMAVFYLIAFTSRSWRDVGEEIPPELRHTFHGLKYKAPCDAELRYTESTHFLLGNNIFDVINGKIPQNEDFIVPLGAGTAPWAFVLGLPFVFPFWPIKTAMMATLFVYVAISAAACFILYKYGKKNLGSTVLALTLPFLYLAQTGFSFSLLLGNHSIIIYAIIIVLAFSDFFEKHQIIGGLILGISMIKPHMALLFFLPLLFQKRFLLIGIAAATVIAAWGFVAFWVDANPLDLLAQCEEQGRNCIIRKDIYMGLVGTIGQSFGFTGEHSVSIMLKIGIVLFGTITMWISYKMRNENKLYVYAIIASITAIWTYGLSQNTTGLYVLMAVPIFISLLRSETVSFFKLAVFALAFVAMMIHIPRNTFGLEEGNLFPYADDISRLYMVFVAFYIFFDAKRQSFYNKLKTYEVSSAKSESV